MKYGISSYVWVSPFSTNDLKELSKAKEMGFDIYEICVEDQNTIDIEQLKEEMKRVDIEIYVCGAFGKTRDISSNEKAIRENGMDYIKNLIDLANSINSPIVSGPMYSATGKTRLLSEKEKAEQKEYALKNIRELATYAAKKGIKLAIEPLNRFETDFMNTTDQAIQFLKELDMENVGLLLDTFHMNIEEKDIAKAIKMAGSKLYNFHACANDRGTPGEDHLDWTRIKEALQEINYHGAMTIESFTQEVKEIAKAVSLWRPLAESQDCLASNGLKFLKTLMEEN